KLEKVAEEKRILVKLPGILQQRARQAQALLERLIEESQVAQRYQTGKRPGDHPDEGRAGDRERGNPGKKLGGAVRAGQSDVFAAEPFPEILIRGLKVIAQREEADFRRVFPGGEQPIVIPGSP